MSNKSKALQMMALVSVLGSQSTVVQSIARDNQLRKGNPEPTDADRNKMKGLKEFYYGENSVWAINQKNADKKAIKAGFIHHPRTT